MNARRLGILSCVATLALTGAASADWPMARHDAQRTGTTTGTSDISKPSIALRAYLGGKLNGDSLRTIDNADGTYDTLILASGRLARTSLDGLVRWRTPSLALEALIGVADLDGDGKSEVIARTRDRVVAFDAASGTQSWIEPAGEMGTIGTVRIADVDGDKRADLIIQECGCCGVSSGKAGFVYSFATGFASAKTLWTLPAAACGGSGSTLVADLDGDGTLEVTNGNAAGRISVLKGSTGDIRATSPDLGTFGDASMCIPADVDGTPGSELVCYQDRVGAPSARKLFVLKFAAGASESLTQLWSVNVGDVEGAIRTGSEVVSDLDGDGKKEIVVSGKNASASTPSTFIYDAVSGSLLATIDDAMVVGIAALEDAKAPSIVSTGAGGTRGHAFKRGASPAVTLRFTLADVQPSTYVIPNQNPTSALGTATFATDLDGDGLAELFVSATSSATKLQAFSGKGGKGTLVGEYAAPAGASLDTHWVVPGAKPPRILIGRDDGVLVALDAAMKATNEGKVRFGGYYASGAWRQTQKSPVVGVLDATPGSQSVLVQNSAGSLLRIDPAGASVLTPATAKWSRPLTGSPNIIPKAIGGKPGVYCTGIVTPVTTPPKHELLLLDPADAKVVWRKDLGSAPLTDVIAGDFNNDGVLDAAVQFGLDAELILHTRAFASSDGKQLWSIDLPVTGAALVPGGPATVDWNGDGFADFVYQADATRIVSGATGLELLKGGPTDAYFMTTLFDVDGDGKHEITLHGGFNAARTLKRDLSALWTGAESDRPYPYGAMSKCSDGRVLLSEGSLVNTARLKITAANGATAGTASKLVLAGGKAYADEAAATTAGAALGQLGSVNGHSNLAGDGKPLMLVGSTDGFLYAVDPCTATLRYAYDFGAAVGEPVFGDTDGDGKDEILVSVGDGYLYALRNEVITSPPFVWDTDPAAGITTKDVDTTTSKTTLSGKWGAVTGADHYEVAVATIDGKPLTTPPWTAVGNVTEHTVTGLTLTTGAQYVFGVRAVVGMKTSVERVSNGVTVVEATGDAGPGDAGPGDAGDAGPGDDASAADAGEPAPEEGGGCGCTTAGAPSADLVFGALFAASLLAVAARRRERE